MDRERIWNRYGMGTEWIQNGYRTGMCVERQQNAFCQAFPVRFLLTGTVPVLSQKYQHFNLDGRQFYSPKSHIANLVCLVLAGESYIEVVLKVKARVIRGNNTTHFIHICSAEL